MNVAFDSWIPVVTTTGKPDKASLISVLTEGEKYADLAVRPHERVALMRLFICVAHAALDGPRNYDEWIDVPEKLPTAVKKYLEEWKDSFELFHPTKPWLQVAELNITPSEKSEDIDDEKGWSTLNKLCFTKASGNNSTLFDHSSNGGSLTEYYDEEIALNLLTFQNFFLAGGRASSRLWGDYHMKNPPNPKGGPCSGKSILYSFLHGKNLAGTIHMNLIHYEDLKFNYDDLERYIGRPLWEVPIKNPVDTDSIANATQTHLGRLVPQTRILKINEDKKRVLLGPGFDYPKFQDSKNSFNPDIFATLIVNKDGERVLLSANPRKAIWRQLHSLTVKAKSAQSSSRGPLCLRNIPDNDSCDFVTVAMITNPKQAADIVDLIESVFHVPSFLCNPDGTDAYESEVKYVERIGSNLGSAIEEYRKEIDAGWDSRLKSAGASKMDLQLKLHSIATIHYWTNAEKNLSLLMNHIKAIGTADSIPTREAWRKMLFSSACDSYRIACGQDTPRQIRAFAKGWDKLTRLKDDKDSDNESKEDNK